MADFDLTYSADLIAAGASRSPIAGSLLELKNNYAAISALIPQGGSPIINGRIDPGESYKYSVAALQNFSAAYMSKSPLSLDLIKFVASAGAGGGLNLLNGPLMTINSVVSQISGTDVIKNAGEYVSSKLGKSLTAGSAGGVVLEGVAGIGTVTASALADGKVTADEGRAIVQSAATFACGAIGAAVGGIAGPIGAAVGVLVGQLIDLLMAAPPPPVIDSGFLKTMSTAEASQALFDKLALERLKVVNYAQGQEDEYWRNLDQFFLAFGNRWADAERNIGFKFGLRWFEDARGPAFYMPPRDLARVGARWTVNYQERIDTAANEANFQTFMAGGQPVTRCLLPMSGCPYPNLVGLPLATTNGYVASQPMYSEGWREVRAFASRGVVWARPEQRLDVDRYIPYPTTIYTSGGPAGIQAYLTMLGTKQREIAVKQAAYRGAQVLLNADLARTTAVMQGYVTMLANKAKYKAVGLNLNEEVGIGTLIERRSSLLNDTALLAGLGVLGFSIWKAVKR